MKIQIDANSVTTSDLLRKLEEQFPNYTFIQRNRKMIVGKKTGSAGVNIIVHKKRILVSGAFPTMGGQLLFTVSLLLLGILIPIILYFAIFKPKHKAAEIEVGEFVKREVEP